MSVAFAVGVWRALHPGPAGTWGSLLLGVFGIGLVAAGVFVPDGAYGFPAGAPAGMPERLSWHAMVHGASASLAFASLAVACFVFVRRFGRQRRWGWLAASVVTGVAAPVLSVWPDSDGASVRFAVATVLVFTWLTALAVQLRSALARAGAH